MSDKTNSSAPTRRNDAARAVPFALAVGAVVLAWQIALQPVVQRAPVEAAIRIAPGSPLVLRRAAEAELAAGRNDNAAALGRDALSRSPFDVRALRVVGLTEARAGRLDPADLLLTLAGNWSLRDDPAHAWLVEHRLRRGDYASAFAHADTLARRRTDTWPQVFRLFTVAAVEDPRRVLPVLVRLLAAKPPWRAAYLTNLHTSNESLQVGSNLVVLLQSSRTPLTTAELQQFYSLAMDMGQLEVVKAVRARLNRPPIATLTNGDFGFPTAPEPFQWSLIQKAGAAAEVMVDDIDGKDPALRVEYDGYSAASIARQRVFLEPGRYRFHAEARIEAGVPAERMAWILTCATGGGGSVLSISAVPAASTPNGVWVTSAGDFSVPPVCKSQSLELRGLPLDRRTPMVVWFDRISIRPLGPNGN